MKKKGVDKTEKLNQALIENFVNLQKVMTNLAVKFDSLSDHISKLLNLFEISARSFAEKVPATDLEKDKEFLDKLNTLLDQNKTIAKGLTLMEEKMRDRLYGETKPVQQPRFQTIQRPSQNQGI
ncbi:MAG: hypothetical protein NT076_05585 [Candidatus Pacearchaeota archaeon]|nr:hypothetical protein [Candidatus Pacearchaeota archaeon]